MILMLEAKIFMVLGGVGRDPHHRSCQGERGQHSGAEGDDLVTHVSGLRKSVTFLIYGVMTGE
jgi:hypothetical protein